MATYAHQADCEDPVVAVVEDDLEAADTALEAELIKRGIDSAAITLPQPTLTQLASFYALWFAAGKGQADEGGPLAAKRTHYRELWKEGLTGLTRAALGLEEPGVGYGSVTVGRG